MLEPTGLNKFPVPVSTIAYYLTALAIQAATRQFRFFFRGKISYRINDKNNGFYHFKRGIREAAFEYFHSCSLSDAPITL